MQQVDQDRTKQFASKLLGIYTGCALTKLIDIGHQTGLFDAGAKRPGTATFVYRNGQRATTLWYHDHALVA